ncbi:o-succinylbenzoate synthase [Flexithrix dorotheae]|uniref:o-succinylbenzoate synthase n=1 Tax=Flexithrix dorotheae TaxID=70993 RepID=UPI00036E2DBB|nr:o-succinylbenzoate synthase [Flexithrix dorotheae]
MPYNIHFFPLKLIFRFDARTSRGAISTKETFIIKISNEDNPEIYGLGECSTLPGLSIDHTSDYENKLVPFLRKSTRLKSIDDIYKIKGIQNYPSIIFGLETAFLDLENGGKRKVFVNSFSEKEIPIPINGLVWMGSHEFMLEQLKEKINKKFTCIKIKVGAIDFEEEVQLLKYIRSKFSKNELTIRLDANGAFSPQNAIEKLSTLSKYDIHSIEQPIKQKQWEAMKNLCKNTPIPIALDEELIGIIEMKEKKDLLDFIQPQYLIFKPSLIGGFKSTREWINQCEEKNIGWWITSALESNIGLNAISQFTGNYNIKIPQGLGTGQLYHNNIPSPLKIQNGNLHYDHDKSWELENLSFTQKI